jgi:hypothetical protein
MDTGERRPFSIEKALGEAEALLKAALRMGCIEHDIADLRPPGAWIMSPDDAHRPLKRLAAQPEFAVERFARKPSSEPGGNMKRMAEPGDEVCPIVVSTNAVQLFGQQPAPDGADTIPGFGKQKWWRDWRLLHRRREAGKGLAQPSLFRVIASPATNMFTAPPVYWKGLVAPGRATAGVDTGKVLENIGPTGGARHLHGLAVA